jgi:hypothetical protein
MKNLALILLAVLMGLASSCALLRKTPAEKVAELLLQHPDLVAAETIRVAVPYAVPAASFERVLVPVHDTIYVQRAATVLDSLLSQLQGRLDSAQRVATTAQLHRLLLSRPVLNDTLCFDTLGVAGQFWRVGRAYRLRITRAPITGTATAPPVVVRKLQPCTTCAELSWYNPAGWGLVWWHWLLIGVLLGALAAALFFRLFVYLLTPRGNA